MIKKSIQSLLDLAVSLQKLQLQWLSTLLPLIWPHYHLGTTASDNHLLGNLSLIIPKHSLSFSLLVTPQSLLLISLSFINLRYPPITVLYNYQYTKSLFKILNLAEWDILSSSFLDPRQFSNISATIFFRCLPLSQGYEKLLLYISHKVGQICAEPSEVQGKCVKYAKIMMDHEIHKKPQRPL